MAEQLSDKDWYEKAFGQPYGDEEPDKTNWHPSPWTGKLLDFDPYGPNPMIDSLKVENPHIYRAAVKGDPVPTMFVGGDLPAFTASGVDPQVLMSFPWNQRHAAAAAPDSSQVFYMNQEHSQEPELRIPHDALTDYEARCRKWATTSGIQRPRYQNG